MNRTLFKFLLPIWLLAFPLSENTYAPTAQTAPNTWQQEMLDQVNQIRAKGCRCGRKRMPPAPPLSWNDQLAATANSHAKDMQRNRFMGHRGSNGSRIGERATLAGYNWQSIAENVAWNTQTVSNTVQGWKNSPGHCKSMMSSAYREMGAANVGAYWVQVFGTEMK